MNFKYLCSQYQLGRFRSVAPLNPGTESQVWRLETDHGAFLVRTLPDKEQGEREWNVYRSLRAGGFAAMPAILVPHFEQSGLWYQIQSFVDGAMPDPSCPGTAAALGRTARELSQALRPLIHGDLGPWNMVQREDGALFVIDFGAVREGDPGYDYASLLGGVINHTPASLRESACREFLRELDCGRDRILEQMELWAEENTARWAGENETMMARFSHALNWAKEHLYEL